MSKLTIITPCSRPENLAALKESVAPGRELFDLLWMVVYDELMIPRSTDSPCEPFIECHWYGDQMSVAGKGQINFALERIELGWVWVLDDDNLVHPSFFKLFDEMTRQYPEAQAFVFSQQHQSGFVRFASPDSVKVAHIDQAQYVLDRSLIGSNRYRLEYAADGEFIERLLSQQKPTCHFETAVMCYYNWLA